MRRYAFRIDQKSFLRIVDERGVIPGCIYTPAAAVAYACNLQLSAGSASVEINERRHRIDFAVDGDHCDLCIDGFYFRVRSEEFSGTSATANARRDLRSEIPGRVVKVLCKAGDVVEAGAVLVVQEAMKMEMPLKVESRHKVREVLVKEGQQIEANVILILFEAAEG